MAKIVAVLEDALIFSEGLCGKRSLKRRRRRKRWKAAAGVVDEIIDEGGRYGIYSVFVNNGLENEFARL